MNIAVITGVSSGIGKDISNKLLKEGWKVYGLSRNEPKINDDNFVWIECDLGDTKLLESKLGLISEQKVDLLISNAGVAFEEVASGVSHQSYEKMFSINVLAPMLLVSFLINKIRESTIISISSVSDRLTDKDFALYCSSKAANTRYFESLADELKKARVFTLLPDYVDTPMLRELQKGREFDWDSTIDPSDLSQLVFGISTAELEVESGANIIVVTNGLIEDLDSIEKLYGYNVDTKELMRL